MDKNKILNQFEKYFAQSDSQRGESLNEGLSLGYLKRVIQQEDDAFFQVSEDYSGTFIYPPLASDTFIYYLRIPDDGPFAMLLSNDRRYQIERHEQCKAILFEQLTQALEYEPLEWNKQFFINQ